MAKKKTETKPKTEQFSPTSEQEGGVSPGFERTAVVALPKFNPHVVSPVATDSSTVNTTPIRQSYESIQQEARGPGVEEWKRTDKLRAGLSATYQSLKEDERYAPEYKSERAWQEYEKVRDQVEKLAPEARQKMLKSAEGLERMSIPVPAGEGLLTKDTNKLLLTAHERTRIESLINRAEKAAEKGPFKASPVNILKTAYEQGLDEGGPSGGATVRAVIQLARDYGLDVEQIVNQHRKPHHHEALENARAARMRAEMIGRTVPEPPFRRPGGKPLPATALLRARTQRHW